jgi:type II secretory pathway pseudopilin PulG
MKRLTPNGFTLVELITVIAVLIVIAALTIGILALVIRKGNVTKALTEIRTMQSLCAAYQIDHGSYPQNADTDALDPRVDVDPASSKYQKASLHLYSCITGDFLPTGAPDGKPDNGKPSYTTLPPRQLSTKKSGEVLFIQDPFGSAYGYSTAGNVVEAGYRTALRSNPNVARPSALKGYKTTFDLWSTGGGKTKQQQPKWVKNWPD